MNLKMFCILCLLLSFFELFYATQVKRQKIWLLFWNSLILSSDFIVICCLGTTKLKDSVEQITLDLFQNCDMPEEVSVTFDPEIDLDDDAVGRCRYEWFYSVRSK